MYEEHDNTPVAAILPRGLAFVVSDNHPERQQIAYAVHHFLIAHIGAGVSGYGLPTIPGRVGLMAYPNEADMTQGLGLIEKFIREDAAATGKVKVMIDMPKPLGRSIDPHTEMILADNFSHVGIVGLASPELISELPLRDASDRAMACGYLAKMAQMAETTILTRMEFNDIDEHEGGRIWGLPELIHSKWAAHILPTEDEGIHQLRIVTNSRVHVQISLNALGQESSSQTS